MYRIHQIKLKLNESIDCIPEKILKKINVPHCHISKWNIVKESIDSRRKDDIRRVYSVDFCVASDEDPKKQIKLKSNPKLSLNLAPKDEYELPKCQSKPEQRPVVCGFGPAGMFAALVLATAGLKPIIIERGEPVDERFESVQKFWAAAGTEKAKDVFNSESNVQFGEGGAGTFSDGKLTTGIKDPRIGFVLKQFVRFGADPKIEYKQKPHIGTDVLRQVVKGLRGEIIRLGGEVRFSNKLVDVRVENSRLVSIFVENVKTGEKEEIETSDLVLCIGHSARDTLRMLKTRNVSMEQKPFSMGVRVEHPQDAIDIAQYGKPARELGIEVADYKLSYKAKDGRGVYTFCMCPGGQIINATSSEDRVVTNGMSNSQRDSGKANSAVLCDISVSDYGSQDPMAGVYFQEKYEKLAFENGGENYGLPRTTYNALRQAYENNGINPVKDSLPDFVVKDIIEAIGEFGRKIKGFDDEKTPMVGIESRSSSPVRITRDESLESHIKGIYPCGEGAGYAGGIMSSACDGLKVALQLTSING